MLSLSTMYATETTSTAAMSFRNPDARAWALFLEHVTTRCPEHPTKVRVRTNQPAGGLHLL